MHREHAPEAAPDLVYQGLSGSNSQGILSQYYDSTGYVSEKEALVLVELVGVSGYVRAHQRHPHRGGGGARKMASANGWSQSNPSDQYVVLPAPGTNYKSSFTATVTSGSATLTNVWNFNDVQQYEFLSGAGMPTNVQVTAINPSQGTITLNKNATASGSAVALTGNATTCGWHDNDGSFVYTLIPFPSNWGAASIRRSTTTCRWSRPTNTPRRSPIP